MKILLIGNGFDLEHDLHTKYGDFLDFIDDFKKLNMTGQVNDIKNEYIKSLFCKDMIRQRCALKLFLENNLWIDYFQKIRKTYLQNKQNWIDFEREIRNIVEKLDEFRRCCEEEKIQLQFAASDLKKKRNLLEHELKEALDIQDISGNSTEKIIDTLIYDLNRLIGGLEIYIWDCIGKYKIAYYNPDIFNINPDKILSFNYSDTYQRLYDQNTSEVEYLYIHGKAENNLRYLPNSDEISEKDIQEFIKNIAENCNMVLGIDEYLSKERRDKEVRFIEFKKYYQRIFKRNGNEYKKWLNEISTSKISPNNILYIFGHSLDETDKDVLYEFIMCKALKTVIFYRDKKQLKELISNLLKVIGYDALLEKVYGKEPTIEFREQSKRKLISDSEFEIVNDIYRIENLQDLSKTEIELLLKKVDEKIKIGNIEYFTSQKFVITLYDTLREKGFGVRYVERLKTICQKIKRNSENDVQDVWKEQMWERECYKNMNKYMECAAETKEFIWIINQYNGIFDREKSSNECSWFGTCKRMIDKKEEFLLQDYVQLVKCGFEVLDREQYEPEEIWQILILLSLKMKTKMELNLSEVLKTDDSDYINRMRVEYLLKRISMAEYEKEKNQGQKCKRNIIFA